MKIFHFSNDPTCKWNPWLLFIICWTQAVYLVLFFLKAEKNAKPTQTTGDYMVHALGLNNPHQIRHAIRLRQDWKSDCNSEATSFRRSFMIIENLHKTFWLKHFIKMCKFQEGQLKRKDVVMWQDSRARPSTYPCDTSKPAIDFGKGRMLLGIGAGASLRIYLHFMWVLTVTMESSSGAPLFVWRHVASQQAETDRWTNARESYWRVCQTPVRAA